MFAAVRGNSRVEIAVLVVSGRTVHASSLGGHDGRRLSHERSPVHHVYRAPDKLPWPISGGPVSRHPGIDSGMGQSCASTYRCQDRTMRDDHCATCASPASHYLRPSAVPVGGLDGPFEVGGSQSVAGRFARFRAPSSRPVCHRDDAARRAWRRHQPPPAHNSVLAQHLLDAPGAASCRAWPRPQRAGGGRPGAAAYGSGRVARARSSGKSSSKPYEGRHCWRLPPPAATVSCLGGCYARPRGGRDPGGGGAVAARRRSAS